MELGRPLGIKPHGLETMLHLRLEKGHIVVGQDTDFDSTPRRLAHNWAVNMDKEDFIGKDALLRTNKAPLDRQLVGFETQDAAPAEGAIIWHDNQCAGYVTSSASSPALGKSVMLGWLKLFDGELPTEVRIGAQRARRVSTPFYDAGGTRARV
jgi:sarcosine oxidase subunit alpha